MASCGNCGGERGSGPYCPACGTGRTPSHAGAERLIGQIIADRYEVVELIDAGGGGRVYRALQRPLDRVVALKIIHPTLLISEEAVLRFMEEARILSRLTHPNVVSVYDFGWCSPDKAGQLFLAMEYVTGPSLSSLLGSKEPLPLRRLASIIGQVLAALGEAHQEGITHRDVKPENIMLMTTRAGADHVKVIDFGIAQSREHKRLTDLGRAVGTPEYMSPEQVRGDGIGPAADLYSVGVILFEALTGRLPFQGGSGVETMMRQLAAPRPDPRVAAPERQITRELAAVCMRALSVEPGERFADAASFADMLEAALPDEAKGTRGLASARASDSRPPPLLAGVTTSVRSVLSEGLLAPVVEFQEREGKTPEAAGTELGPALYDLPLVGRSAELDWAIEQLVHDSGACVALCGRAGIGKTRLLRELCATAEGLDMTVAVVAADAAPVCHVGYALAKRMIVALSGLCAAELASVEGVTDGAVQAALHDLFAPTNAKARQADVNASAALEWAARVAVARSSRQSAVLVLDDADRADGCSLAALTDLLRQRSVPRLAVLMSAQRLPDAMIAAGVAVRGLRGLTPAQAAQVLGGNGAASSLPRSDDIEPLYVECGLRWDVQLASLGGTLYDAVAERIRKLSSDERRVLLAISVFGNPSSDELRELLGHEAALEAVENLLREGLVVRHQSTFEAAHPVYARAVRELSPQRVLSDLHARAADLVGNGGGPLELHAYHAVQGRPDVEAFLLVEEVARVRKQRRDHEGVASILRFGLEAARNGFNRGDTEAGKALAVFGRKLGAALVDLGRLDEAHLALSEALNLAGLRELDRALLLEQLATVEKSRGRPQEADRLRVQCLEAAQRCGESEIIARVTNSGDLARRFSSTAVSRSPFSVSGGYQIRISDVERSKAGQGRE